tara:strand:- start:413 stop:673 length:261 start_codon:yes stop_codon:yes gene_type:complete
VKNPKYRKRFKRKPKRKNKDIGTRVQVYDNNLVDALRRFKRRVEKAKILEEVRDRQFYEKPSAKRRALKKKQKSKHRTSQKDKGGK